MNRITLQKYADDSLNEILCVEESFGYFASSIEAVAFIKKHNHLPNTFFTVKSYVFNPTHGGQCIDYLFEMCYDSMGELICKNPTYHFTVNFKELHGDEFTYFKGRDDDRLHKGDFAWFYDSYEKKLCKCKIGEVPFTSGQYKKYKKYQKLDWREDSYLVYPLDDQNNHQHILSCYIFTEDFINNLLDNK